MSTSTDTTGTDDDGDGGPGRREVAHRIFAGEFDDASLSYSESDEERAPNYVVTPTGARVNRLFAVGVLTAVEAVNEETLRARIADPTGAFVSYAGQYQPDEMAFLDRTTPPAFLALTGKARTFEPEDSDRVFTSVRPESINEVDADTRDRWVVETARATLDRVRIFADALDTGLTGEDLRTHLESQGVAPALAAGIPLAMDHYGTTTAYLEAVRTLAVETLEVVADERDEASALELAPDEGGDAELGPLPAGDTDLSVDVDVSAESPGDTDPASTAEADADATSTPDADATSTPDADATSTPDADTTSTGESEDAPAGETDDATAGEPDTETATEADDIVSASDTGSTATSDESSSSASTETESDDSAESTTTTTDGTASTDSDTGGSDDLGDFDAEAETTAETGADDLGDFDAGGTSSDGASESSPEADVESPEDLDDVLDDETREAVKTEHGVDFSTGNEVDDPGEADIDVPDADDLEEMAADAEAESGASADASDSAAANESDTATADDSGASDSDSETAAADDAAATDPEDVDLESAALDAMRAEDTGNGAPREEVIAAVVAEHGVPEDAVEDAIQEALMSGLCYEAGDGLKPI